LFQITACSVSLAESAFTLVAARRAVAAVVRQLDEQVQFSLSALSSAADLAQNSGLFGTSKGWCMML